MVDKQSRQSRFNVDEDQPSSWFEPLYAGSSSEGGGIPWAGFIFEGSIALFVTTFARPVATEGG